MRIDLGKIHLCYFSWTSFLFHAKIHPLVAVEMLLLVARDEDWCSGVRHSAQTASAHLLKSERGWRMGWEGAKEGVGGARKGVGGARKGV